MLVKYIEDSRALWEDARETLEYVSIGSVVGTHAGPGAIAVAFFRKG
jgi:fatty acid-binding protein DegV